jgi:hypothetical protein
MDRIKNLPVSNCELTFIFRGCGSTIVPPYSPFIHYYLISLAAKDWSINVDIIWLVSAWICLHHMAGAKRFKADEAKLCVMSHMHIF